MKATTIPSAVLGGQGSIGSAALTVANPAPPQGPMAGDAGAPDLQIPISAPLALDAQPASGGPSTATSQYDLPED